MISLKTIKNQYIKSLSELYPEEESKNIFYLTAANLLHYSKSDCFLYEEKIIDFKLFNITLDELLTGKPIQQILGFTYFYDLKIAVNEHTLIPRPETEELVNILLNRNKNQQPIILDLCTGSGCIALALKAQIKNAIVYGVDISADALELANKNANSLDLEVQFIQQNILEEAFTEKTKMATIWVSNPPYVLHSEKKTMHKNVLNYEPHLALFTPIDAPILFYKKIINDWITSGALELYMELNPLTTSILKNYLNTCNLQNTAVEICTDFNNKERFLILTKR